MFGPSHHEERAGDAGRLRGEGPDAAPLGLFDDDAGPGGQIYYFTSGGLFICSWQSLPGSRNWDFGGGSEENFDEYCS